MKSFLILLLLLAGSAQATTIGSAPVKVDGATIENVGGLRVKDGGITAAKKAPLAYSISSSSGAYQVTNGADVENSVPNASVTITSTGRPLWIGLVPDGSASPCYVAGNGAASSTVTAITTRMELRLYESTTLLSSFLFSLRNGGGGTAVTRDIYVDYPCSMVSTVIFPTAGAHTYTLKMFSQSGTANQYHKIGYSKLLAFEL